VIDEFSQAWPGRADTSFWKSREPLQELQSPGSDPIKGILAIGVDAEQVGAVGPDLNSTSFPAIAGTSYFDLHQICDVQQGFGALLKLGTIQSNIIW